MKRWQMDFTEAREKKPTIIATICKEQLNQAVKYLEDKSSKVWLG
jgi:phosphopantetheinyl transferase